MITTKGWPAVGWRVITGDLHAARSRIPFGVLERIELEEGLLNTFPFEDGLTTN